MKKHLLLPVLFLCVGIAACGKKDEPVATTVQPIGAAPVTPSPWYPWNPGPGGNDLQSFCSYYGGQLSGGVCRLTRYFNFSYSGWGDVTSPVVVYSGQRVSVQLSGSARVFVGGVQQATGSSTFISTANGYVGFQKYSSFYTIQGIQVQSCYNAPNQAVSCN